MELQMETIRISFVHLYCRFDDFDDAIDEAIEEDIGDLCSGKFTMQTFYEMNCNSKYTSQLSVLGRTSDSLVLISHSSKDNIMDLTPGNGT